MYAKALLLAIPVLLTACAGEDMTTASPQTTEERDEVALARSELLRADPNIGKFFREAYGYAIFPSVGKGGLVVGGARGEGWLHERGNLVGRAELNQVTVGAQAGGQGFTEVIFFRDEASIEKFKAGDLELGASVGAVALKNQALANAGYDTGGMLVVVVGRGGLMVEASVGGQTFDYEPIGR